MKKSLKKTLIATCLSATIIAPLAGCSSTTSGGAVGADRKQLLLVSSDKVMQLSGQAYQQTINEARMQGKLDVDRRQTQRLERIARRLIAQTHIYRPDAKNWQWEVHIINDPETNAYVMAGGKIVFFSGIINKLNLTDNEIAAIMGHEMAHALREHSREQISRSTVTSGLINIASSMLGLSSGQAQLAGALGEIGLNLPHSRTQESEADKIGLELMARAGYNPQAGISLWRKMSNLEGGSSSLQFLSTHPSNAKRIEQMQALMPKIQPLYQQSAKHG